MTPACVRPCSRRLTPSPPPPTASACSRAGRGRRAGLAQEPRRAPGRVLRGGARAARAAPDPRARPGQQDAPARRARPSWERIPHFRMALTPSNGDELQSEYLIARADAVAALEALRAIGGAIAPCLQVSEIRTVAADRLRMSTAYGRDSVAIHFTFRPEPIDDVLRAVESALAPFDPRPQLGQAVPEQPRLRAPGRLPRAARARGPAGARS